MQGHPLLLCPPLLLGPPASEVTVLPAVVVLLHCLRLLRLLLLLLPMRDVGFFCVRHCLQAWDGS